MANNLLWTRDELILVLNAYFQHSYRNQAARPSDEVVGELSSEIRSLPIYPEDERSDRFRSRDAVAIRLKNFAGMDEQSPYEGRGTPALQLKVWNEFGDVPEEVDSIARRIWERRDEVTSVSLAEASSNKEQFREGRILSSVHRRRERNSSLVERKKEKVLEETGSLDCEACGFNFKAFYGDIIDTPYAECHHRTPLSELEGPQKTSVNDLALLCANCHKAIHRTDPMISVADLQKHLQRT